MKHTESGLMVPDDYVTGGGKVELFNERDRKVDEIPFSNFISAQMLQDQKWWTRFAYSGGIDHMAVRDNERATNPGTGTLYEERIWNPSRTDPMPRELMRWLVLSNNSAATAPSTEKRMKGTKVGYADKSYYTGTDTFRGSFNAVESTVNPGYARWVFDWPTSAGNGTFQSIHWAYDNQTDYVTADYAGGAQAVTLAGIAGQGANEGRCATWVAGSSNTEFWQNHFYSGNDPIAAGYKIVRRRLSDGAVLSSIQEPYPTSGAFSEAICDDGTGLWLGWWAGNTLRKFSYTGTLLTTLTPPAAPDGTLNVSALAYDAATGNLWMSRNGGKYLTAITTSGTLVGHYGNYDYLGYISASVPGVTLGGLLSISGTKMLVQNNTHSHLFIVDLSAPNTIEYAISMANNGNYGALITDGGETIYNMGNGVMYKYRQTGNLATRARLAAPVTKTNLQTMKITYEFDFS